MADFLSEITEWETSKFVECSKNVAKEFYMKVFGKIVELMLTLQTYFHILG